MAILLGIDGTGAMSNRAYGESFSESFVRRIIRGSLIDEQSKRYLRGPIAPGGGLVGAISEGTAFVLDRHRKARRDAVLLTGFSRGAAGVIVVAKRLQREGVNVAAMLLFDAVDRHIAIDAEWIPNNVARVLHIRRDPRARSRESFGSAGTRWSPPTIYRQRFFVCTHGAVGGTYWKPGRGESLNDLVDEGFPDGKTAVTYAADKRASEAVWAYVRLNFQRQFNLA